MPIELLPVRRIVPRLRRKIFQSVPTRVFLQPIVGPAGVLEIDGETAFVIA